MLADSSLGPKARRTLRDYDQGLLRYQEDLRRLIEVPAGRRITPQEDSSWAR
ncbi:MAG: hypothetical protein HY319_20990 [Armatimonadetes bacterium]|nr:hypothetical protein [Armatimonadota bacterium]